MLTPGQSVSSASANATTTPGPRSQRILACVQCQQRKIKCDRRFPCANCTKSNSQCIPGAQVAKKRRRRFPERELLERLRHYEDLLRQNNVKFEPLHPEQSGGRQFHGARIGDDSDDEQPQSISAKPETEVRPTNIWHAMSREFRDDPDNVSDSSEDEIREGVVKKAWNQVFETHDDLLFGSPRAPVDISSLHPDPVQIFKLWQLYLESVDPLLKVTHAPSLQGRIIEAAGSVWSISPNLEALMFSIYSMAISTLDEEECPPMFGSPKHILLTRYQFGCQQALHNASFLRTDDRECLTALFLYLFSARLSAVPQSLSSLLGIAIRIAQRMGIDSEATLAKCTTFEAEMRRRLWWSLSIFDARAGEMAGFKNASLDPTWSCKALRNLNDLDLRPEIKDIPQAQATSSDALFAVVRSEMADFVRHSTFHISFSNPALKSIAKNFHPAGESELKNLERMLEEKYLRHCDPTNPLHFVTIWMTRTQLAKCFLMDHHCRYADAMVPQTDAQRNAAVSFAFDMLAGDTKMLTSPLAKPYLWLLNSYFPFPAYMHILQHVKRRPVGDQADKAWNVLNDSFEARFEFDISRIYQKQPFFTMLMQIVLRAWDTREMAFRQMGAPLMTPTIILSIRQMMPQEEAYPSFAEMKIAEQPSDAAYEGINNIQMPGMPTSFDGESLDVPAERSVNATTNQSAYPTAPAPPEMNLGQLDWSSMDWAFGDLADW